MDEVAKLKTIIAKLEKSLDETQKSLDKLQQLTIPTTEEVVKLLRDSENYHKINDDTESRK